MQGVGFPSSQAIHHYHHSAWGNEKGGWRADSPQLADGFSLVGGYGA